MGEREGAAAALCLLAGPGRGRALPWHRVDGGGASSEHVRSAARGRSATRDHAHMAPGHAPPPWNQATRRRQPRPTAGLVATLPRASQTLPTSLLCVPGPRLRRSATGRAALLQQFAPGLCSQRPAPPGPRLSRPSQVPHGRGHLTRRHASFVRSLARARLHACTCTRILARCKCFGPPDRPALAFPHPYCRTPPAFSAIAARPRSLSPLLSHSALTPACFPFFLPSVGGRPPGRP